MNTSTTYRTATKLQKAVDNVNRRYSNGQNDDDQVALMINIDKNTKGFSFYPLWDSYTVITDQDKLFTLSEKHGYWSKQVEQFNDVLLSKGGFDYMNRLNNQCKEHLKTLS